MNCWFCEQIEENPKKSLALNMYGEVDSKTSDSVTKVAYNVRKINVPRCDSCKERHSLSSMGIILAVATFVLTLIAVILTVFEFFEGMVAGLLIGFLVGLIVTGIAIKIASIKNIKSIHKAKTVFPQVRELLLKNYKFGKKPKDYETESKDNQEDFPIENE